MEVFPLTLTQNDICLDQLRHSHSPLYNVGGYVRLRRVDRDRLAEAHRRIVSECDVFGLRILFTDNGIAQAIGEARNTSLPLRDFSNAQDPTKAANEWQTDLFETAFDITGAELFRAFLVKVADDHYRYLGLAHHLMMDGWGFSNWARLLGQLYNDPSSEIDTGISWREVALDDEKYLASEKYIKDRSYWTEHVQRIPPPLLASRYRATPGKTAKIPSRRWIIEISRREFNEWKSLAETVGAGVAHYFLAMLAVYFANSSGQNRVVFGLPFHNRRNQAQKRALGVFTSVSPLGVDVSDAGCTFAELLQTIAKRQKAHFRRQRYPLGHIIRDLAEAGEQRSLYDVGFNYLRLGGGLSFAETEASLVYLSHNHEATPLLVTLCESGESEPVQLQLDYNLAYFSDADIRLLGDRFSFLLRSLLGAFETPLRELEILPGAERARLCEGFGDGPLQDTSSGCIHHLFEAQVRRTPDAIAVTSAGRSLTYAELNEQSNRLAHYLIRHGVKPETLVGIYLKRTEDVLICVLGILKAGGAYVPIDTAQPPHRVRVILEDGGVCLVLTNKQPSEVPTPADVQVITLAEALAEDSQNGNDPAVPGLTSANLSHVIYTSGSTGKPKGVQICHANVVALLDWVRAVFRRDELQRVLCGTSLSFDLSVFEMFAPLIAGGGRCIVVENVLELLSTPIEVSLINTVPSVIKVLLEQNAIPPGVRVVNLAGEPLPEQVVNDLLAGNKCERVFNLYGPTEDTTYSTYAFFEQTITGTPSIGRAIAGTRVYILSPQGKLTPMGDIGELYLAGDGLARGYLNSPELTAEKFISNPFSATPGDRLYKTGDLVHYRPEGTLQYVGRADAQVKIRGFRIELGEIQRQLEQINDVRTAVVLTRERSSLDKYLVAYVELKDGVAGGISNEIVSEKLQRILRTYLPEHMVPAAIVVLKELPLLSNGKIDGQALLLLDGEVTVRREYVAPESRTEKKLVELWASLLGVDGQRVGVTTSLFDLGGHSLLLVRLANAIKVEFGVALSMRSFFKGTNLRDLAQKIEAEATFQFIEQKLNNAVIVSDGYL
jgi:amino acid adenylation domain-containing protein